MFKEFVSVEFGIDGSSLIYRAVKGEFLISVELERKVNGIQVLFRNPIAVKSKIRVLIEERVIRIESDGFFMVTLGIFL